MANYRIEFKDRRPAIDNASAALPADVVPGEEYLISPPLSDEQLRALATRIVDTSRTEGPAKLEFTIDVQEANQIVSAARLSTTLEAVWRLRVTISSSDGQELSRSRTARCSRKNTSFNGEMPTSALYLRAFEECLWRTLEDAAPAAVRKLNAGVQADSRED